MSLVYITYHNENVLDYEKVGYVEEPIKPLKYVSRHRKAVKKQINLPYISLDKDGRLLISEHGKHQRRTMGCAKTPLNPPHCFLKKNQGLKWKRLHDHQCFKPDASPPIPRVADIPPKKVCPPKVATPKVKTPAEVLYVAPTQPTPMEVKLEATPVVTPRQEPVAAPAPPVAPTCPPPPTCDPCAYLKKQKESPRSCRAAGGGDEPDDCMQFMEPLPPAPKEKTPRDPCKKINYIKRNIKRVQKAQTKRPPPRYIDTPKGETHNLLHSGLLPEYMCHRNFAKVPCYLKHHKKFIKAYQEVCKQDLHTKTICPDIIRMSGVRKMTLDERVELLQGLKANYAEQLKIFQTLSLYTDTPTKKLRKARLEKDLDQLEWDITFIQDNRDIYIHMAEN